MHSILSVERKKSLQTWVLLLALVSFILCVLGTFLVRSGILTSVHTFALDPSRGIFILSLIFLLGFYAFIIFAMKARFFINKNNFIFLSKEGLILVNNLIMIIVCNTYGNFYLFNFFSFWCSRKFTNSNIFIFYIN